MADTRQLSNEEILAILNAKAKAEGDNFRIRVFRRAGLNAMGMSVATLDGASVVHFAAPETWLPRLMGGGPYFSLQAFHANDITTACAPMLTFQIPGDERPLDYAAVKAQGWAGPAKVIWPEPPAGQQQINGFGISLQPMAAPPLGATAPQPHVPVGNGPPSALNSDTAAAWARLENDRAALDNQRRELLEMRHRMDLDRLKAEQDLRFKELETKLAAPQKPAPGIAEMIAPLVPVIQLLIQGQNEMRVAMLNQQQQAQQQQQTLLMSLMEKKTDDSPSTKVFASMSESMGAVFKMQTDLMQRSAEIAMGPQDPPGLRVVQELVKGVNAIASGMGKVSVKKPGQPVAGALPAGKQAKGKSAPAPVQQYAPPAGATAVAQPAASVAEAGGIPNSVDRIEAMIRAKLDPAVVASEFIVAIDDPAMAEALTDAGGDPVALFQSRLDGWALEDAANVEYIRTLVPEIQSQLEAAGMLEDEDEIEDAQTVEGEAAPVATAEA